MQSLISETKGNEDRMGAVIPLIDQNIISATHRMMTDPEEEEGF